MPKAKYTKWAEAHSLFIDELKRRSEARVQANPEFHYVMEDMERLRRRLDENRISLNEEVRRGELNEDKLRKEARTKDRLARQSDDTRMYRLTLDTVDKPNLQLITFPSRIASSKKGGAKVAPEAAADSDSDLPDGEDSTKEAAIDPERDETFNILADLVDLSRGPKTASVTPVSTP